MKMLALCPGGRGGGGEGGQSSWREGASLALVGHPSSDGVTVKMPYGVDVLH